MSNFAGTWHYARHTAEGMAVVRNMATITVMDDEDGIPKMVKIELSDPKSPPLELPVDDEKTALDISFNGEDSALRGRLVILSPATPAILVGSIHQPTPPASGGKPRGTIEDHNIDVFIAVKVC